MLLACKVQCYYTLFDEGRDESWERTHDSAHMGEHLSRKSLPNAYISVYRFL